jgi:LacI family transcriptional regulator
VSSLTIEQIAALAKVSRSTVSRVLNNHPSVRPEVRRRIYAVINEQGYTPRAAARNLARRQTKLIGILIRENASFVFSTPFFSSQIDGITNVCVERGYFPLLSMLTVGMNPGVIEDVMRSRHFDGIILHGDDANNELLELLFKMRIPVVQFGHLPYFPGLSWVGVADKEGAYLATRHLISLGHSRIGMIVGPAHLAVSRDRQAGYEQALREAGLAVLPELIGQGDHMQEGGYTGMTRLLSLSVRPTAVFASNDPTAFGAMQAIDNAGLTVPGDVAVVGFDDLPASATTRPPLTTVHQPIAELGAAAAKIVIDLVERKYTEPVQLCLPTHLVVRRSCGAPVPMAALSALEVGVTLPLDPSLPALVPSGN